MSTNGTQRTSSTKRGFPQGLAGRVDVVVARTAGFAVVPTPSDLFRQRMVASLVNGVPTMGRES